MVCDCLNSETQSSSPYCDTVARGQSYLTNKAANNVIRESVYNLLSDVATNNRIYEKVLARYQSNNIKKIMANSV